MLLEVRDVSGLCLWAEQWTISPVTRYHHPSKVSLLPRAPPCLLKSSVPATWKQRCSSLLHIWEGEGQQEGRCAVIKGPHCTPRITLPVSPSPSCSRHFHHLGRPLPHCCSIICVYCGLCAFSLPADPSASFFQGFFTISGSKRVFLVSIIIINLKHFSNYFHGFGVRKANASSWKISKLKQECSLVWKDVCHHYSEKKKKKLEASVSREMVTEWAQQSIFPHSS